MFAQDGGNGGDMGEISTQALPMSRLHDVGTLGSLQTLQSTPDGGVVAWFLAHRRIRIQDAVREDPLPPLVNVHHVAQRMGEA